MASDTAAAGFYGKLPALGDFVGRRLGRDFIAPWDEWLQQVMVASRQRLGDAWLDAYLTSPLWRFVLAPGLCGQSPRAGVLMPSCDRVGRNFPLAIVATLPPGAGMFRLSQTANGWFEEAEAALFSTLDEEVEFSLPDFDARVQSLSVPAAPTSDEVMDEAGDGRSLLFTLGGGAGLGGAYAGIAELLAERSLGAASVWWTAGSDEVLPALRVCAGLPSPEVFAHMLCGQEGGQQAAASGAASSAVAAGAGLPSIEDAGFDEAAGLLDGDIDAADASMRGHGLAEGSGPDAASLPPGEPDRAGSEATQAQGVPVPSGLSIPDDDDLLLPPAAVTGGAIPEDADLDLEQSPSVLGSPGREGAPGMSPDGRAPGGRETGANAVAPVLLPEDLDLEPPSAAMADAPSAGAAPPAIADAGLTALADDFGAMPGGREPPVADKPAEGGLPFITDAGVPAPEDEQDAFMNADARAHAGKDEREAERAGVRNTHDLPAIEDAGLPSDEGFGEDKP